MPKKKTINRKVCRNCKAILPYNVVKCPYCGSSDFVEEYAGFVIIINSEKSQIAREKNLKEGIWAIKLF
ncbi:DNA-binding protein [Nanoarchaeota archaeon NZ13-N]|nr:MAG: DNA-binding protein [Nanoarchaeota archaeon NZ13-N]